MPAKMEVAIPLMGMISSCHRCSLHPPARIVKEFDERRHPMTSVFLAASALEVGLVVIAGVIFLAMVVAAVALVVWSIAGFVRAAHPV
jgi:hypothetical protein